MGLIDEILNANTASIPYLAQQPSPAPQSPDLGGPSPVSDNAPQQKQNGGIKAFLGTAMKNFLSGAQQSLADSGGLNDASLKRAQSSHLDAQTNLANKQAEMMSTMVTINDPNTGSPITMPYAVAQKAFPAVFSAGGRVKSAQIGADSKENVANTNATSRENVAKINQGQGVPVDETIANVIGMPELAGVSAGKGTWGNINSRLKASGYQYKDLGQEGLWLVDRVGNKIKRMADSPAIQTAVARGEGYARGRAQWTPFETVDDNGNPTTISTAQALATGAPGISRTNLTQVRGKQALIDDIRGGVEQVRQTSQVLDRPGVKMKVAAALADPGLTSQTLLQSPVVASMQPDEQQYVINLLNLKENAMAMRSVLGAGQGSEDLRSAITKTIPNAMTPNAQYANAQLDTFLNTLSRLEKGIPSVKKPGVPQAVRDRMPKAGGNNPPAGSKVRDYTQLGR